MSRFDFSQQQITTETTREYTFDLLPGRPSIIVAPAHDSNPVYFDERLRISIAESERIARLPRGKKRTRTTPEEIKANIERDRDADRRLIAKACARAWGNAPTTTDGATPPLDEELALDFFRALPTHHFDPFRNFVANLANFVDDPNEEEIDEDEAAGLGNS